VSYCLKCFEISAVVKNFIWLTSARSSNVRMPFVSPHSFMLSVCCHAVDTQQYYLHRSTCLAHSVYQTLVGSSQHVASSQAAAPPLDTLLEALSVVL
jgi:hypothetical protein